MFFDYCAALPSTVGFRKQRSAGTLGNRSPERRLGRGENICELLEWKCVPSAGSRPGLSGLLAIGISAISAQTIDDGVMVPRKTIFTGVLYTHDSWDHYWEGALQFPMTDYQPDFQPLSIGLGSARVGARATVQYQSTRKFYVTGTAAYAWQRDLSIDAPYYFTNNQLFLTNVVKMPDVVSC